MANTNATYATSISVDLPDYPAAVVTFTNTAFFVSGNSEVLPGKQYSLTLDSSGQGTQTLPCPDNTGDSAINWRINLPSKESGTYAIAYSATAQNLSDILAAQSTTADPDVITSALAAKANKLPGGTEDNLFSIDADGDLQDSGFAAADFDAAGAAAAAQSAAQSYTDGVAATKMDKDTDGTPGNLTVLDADKNAVDAGYAADVNAAALNVVRRNVTGGIQNVHPDFAPLISISGADSITAASQDGYAIYAISTNGAGVYSEGGGTYHHEFGAESGIRSADGVLEFRGGSAATNRAAQRAELGLGTAALEDTTAFVPADAAFVTTATNYTTLAADAAKEVLVSAAATITLANGMDSGFQQVISRVGSGAVTISAATTLRKLDPGTGYSTIASATLLTTAVVRHLGSNVWLITGDFS